VQQIAPLEVGLPVIDLNEMLNFYSEVLGCEEVRRADIPADLSNAIKTSAAGYINVWLRTPNGEVIKLVSPPQSPQRAERLEQIKAAINDGTYETQEKLDIALDRLLGEINKSDED